MIRIFEIIKNIWQFIKLLDFQDRIQCDGGKGSYGRFRALQDTNEYLKKIEKNGN